MNHQKDKNTPQEEIPFAQRLLTSPLIDKIIDNKERIAYSACGILVLVIFCLYMGSRREEQKLKDIALSASYVQQLVHQEKAVPHESNFEIKERKARYERALQGLQELVAGSAEIKARFGSVLAESLLLQPKDSASQPLAQDAVKQLQKVGMNEYATFSSVADLLHSKQYKEAAVVLDRLAQQIIEEKKQQHGLLLSMCLLQRAAVAKEEGDEALAEKTVAQLKEMLLQAGPQSPIAREDADHFLKLVQDKNASLLDFIGSCSDNK